MIKLRNNVVFLNLMIGFIFLTISTFSFYSASAKDTVIDDVSIRVKGSCTITGTGMDSHTATINPGTYTSNIGTTTLKVYCNDNDGFSIYAVGYTDEIDGKNVLTSSELGSTYDIVTGTLTSGDSQWAMKLATDSAATYPVQLQNNYGNYHTVPSDYELVAKRTAATDVGVEATGSTLTTTYQVYASSTQPAETYNGKVKYVMVHPNTSFAASYTITYDANTTDTITDLPEIYHGSSTSGAAVLSSLKPEREGYGFFGWCTEVPTGPNCSGTTYKAGAEYPLTEGSANNIELHAIWGTYAMLDTGKNVNAKMKSLAAGTSVAYNTETSDIKAVRMASSLPSGFTPSDANTISISGTPAYIYYDNTNDGGVMYVYTTADKVWTNPTSSSLFYRNNALADISGVADWDTSNTTTFASMFSGVTSLSDISALSNWDTSSVTSFLNMFYGATSLSDISALSNLDTSNATNFAYMFMNDTNLSSISAPSNWDTSNIKSFSGMFYGATSLSDISALSNWDTSNATSFFNMFRGATSLSDISALSNWDTSNATSFAYMFLGTSISDISSLANWDTSNITNMRNMFWNTRNLIDLSPLANWNTSKVKNMAEMFGLYDAEKVDNAVIDLRPLANWNTSSVTDMSVMFQHVNIASFRPLANWDVSSVETFEYMFNQYVNESHVVTSLAGLENWNVSSAKNMRYMFAHIPSLNDASAINNWDITGVTAEAGSSDNNFYKMFFDSSTSPNFTKRAGTWNSYGTFIPSA